MQAARLYKVGPFVFSVDPHGLSLSRCGGASASTFPQPAFSSALAGKPEVDPRDG